MHRAASANADASGVARRNAAAAIAVDAASNAQVDVIAGVSVKGAVASLAQRKVSRLPNSLHSKPRLQNIAKHMNIANRERPVRSKPSARTASAMPSSRANPARNGRSGQSGRNVASDRSAPRVPIGRNASHTPHRARTHRNPNARSVKQGRTAGLMHQQRLHSASPHRRRGRTQNPLLSRSKADARDLRKTSLRSCASRRVPLSSPAAAEGSARLFAYTQQRQLRRPHHLIRGRLVLQRRRLHVSDEGVERIGDSILTPVIHMPVFARAQNLV